MSKKSYNKYYRPKKVLPTETEAAWYVLKDFLNLLDCSEKGFKYIKDKDSNTKIPAVFPLNDNSTLASILSGENKFRPSYMSKTNLSHHLTHFSTYYYRCKYNAVHTEGYGSSDKQAQKLPFSKYLNITHKRTKYESMYIILLGVDIDAHNGETDFQGVQNWLKTDYFPQSYWEPSSNFSGRHGYIKLAYSADLSLYYVISVLKELFGLLDNKRKKLGFLAPVDVPCGLPSTIKLVDENPYPVTFIPDSPPVDDTPIKSGGSSDNNTLILSPSDTDLPETGFDSSFHSFCSDISDSSSGPFNGKYLKIERSQAFKLPRFNSTDHTKCNMEDIISFHNLHFYKFSYFENLLYNLKNELITNKTGEKNNKEREERRVLTIVCSPPENTDNNNYATEVNWGDTKDSEFDLNDYWTNKKRSNGKIKYEDKIKEYRNIQDTMEKTRKFYWCYSLHLRKVPPTEIAVEEYVKQGLNTSSDVDSDKRLSRFKSCRKFIEARFGLTKCGFHLDDWEGCKSRIINMVSNHIDGNIEPKWSKDSKKSYILEIEEVGLVYFAILKSNEYDRNNKDMIVRNSFSYKMINKVFWAVFEKGCHRAKSAKILKILKQAGLIEKTGNHIAGIRGTCYKAVKISA